MDYIQLAYGILENNYIRALAIALGFYIISQIVVFIFEKIILRLARKTKTKVDDLIVEAINKPIALILLLFGLRLGLNTLAWSSTIEQNIEKGLISIIILVGGFIIMRVVDILIDNWGKEFAKKTKSTMDDALLSLFHKFSKAVIIIMTLLYILQTWGVEIAPLLASLGIAGLAIAFALQNTLGNIFGGISLIIDKAFEVGDIIKLDSGESGVVHDIGIRSTRIRTWNNEIITVPNGKLADARIQNFNQPDPKIRIDITFGVEYESDPDKVKKVALNTLKTVKNVIKDPAPNILFLEMADFSLNFKLMFWVDDLSKKWDTHQEVITNLYNDLNKNKIGIPFPTRTIHMKK